MYGTSFVAGSLAEVGARNRLRVEVGFDKELWVKESVRRM